MVHDEIMSLYIVCEESNDSMICGRCGFQSAYEWHACPNCLDLATVVVEPLDESEPIQLSKIIADPVEAVITKTPFDLITGAGVPRGSAILISGPAGCGKSTWALKIASAWEGTAWYCAYERTPEALRRDAERLGVDMDRIWICDPEQPPARYAHPRGLLVIDSVNEFATRMEYGLLGAVRFLSEHAWQSGTTIVMIAHVTKEWDVVGSERVKHAVDVLVEIIPGFQDQRTGVIKQNVACHQKNRFGPLWQRLVEPPWM